MDDRDHIPVRGPSKGRAEEENFNQNAANQEARIVARLSREDLEDKYLRMYEDNLILKRHARKQEDKIKKMATKLLRLVNDKKRGDAGTKKGRDIENEEIIEDLKVKVMELEKQNLALRDKLLVTKQHLTSGVKRTNPYDGVQSRINSGLARPPQSERIAKSMRVAGPAPKATPQSPTLPRYGHSLLEQTRSDVRHLEDVIAQQNEQITVYEQDIEMLKEQILMKEADFEEDLLKIKQQVAAGQRANLQENVDLIRLQRQVKEKGTKLTALQAQYNNLEDNTRTIKDSHDRVMAELESLNQQLKSEQNRNLALKNQLKSGSTKQGNIVELEERVSDLRNENKILKEANEKLVSSAFDLEREREWRQRENSLKVQIAQLEATLKADVGEKGSILDRLSGERQNAEKLEKELREERLKYFQVKEEHDELKEKMKFFTRESAVDFNEIEEALVMIKQRKEKTGAEDISFLEQVDDEKQKDLEKEVNKLQADHAETIEELEKTRNMLIVQHKINKDYQSEVEAVTRKMEDNRQEYDTKLDEYARLLDLRAARIKKLESQMKDVAYGTRQYRVPQPTDDGAEPEDVEEIDETIHLERGQNLFEIHVSKVILSADGTKLLGDDDPSLFCTWEFFEFETQSTPVVKGNRPEFDFTSQYVVKVDDFFLHHLQKESTTLELHQALGTEFRTVAACQLKFRDIFEKPHGRVMGAAELIGIAEGAPGYSYGTVEFWVRLKVPMDQALRLYKERTKALGYLSANQRAAEQAVSALDESAAHRPDDNVNELHVKIIRCKGVKARREGMQPSPYCVYKFFDFPDHDSAIVPNTNNPEFMDHKTYPVPMTADMDSYIKSQPLQVYVFDDTDPEEVSYLGVATVPMLALAHDKAIKGTFELKKASGEVNGVIDIDLKWQYSYIPPKAATKTVAQILASTPQLPHEKPAMMPGEDISILSGAPSAVSGPSAIPRHMTGPSAMSTPKPRSLTQQAPLQGTSPSSTEPRPITMTPITESGGQTPIRPVPLRRPDSKKTVEFSNEVTISGEDLRGSPPQPQSIVQAPSPQPVQVSQPAKGQVDVLVEKSKSGKQVFVDVVRTPKGGSPASVQKEMSDEQESFGEESAASIELSSQEVTVTPEPVEADVVENGDAEDTFEISELSDALNIDGSGDLQQTYNDLVKEVESDKQVSRTNNAQIVDKSEHQVDQASVCVTPAEDTVESSEFTGEITPLEGSLTDELEVHQVQESYKKVKDDPVTEKEQKKTKKEKVLIDTKTNDKSHDQKKTPKKKDRKKKLKFADKSDDLKMSDTEEGQSPQSPSKKKKFSFKSIFGGRKDKNKNKNKNAKADPVIDEVEESEDEADLVASEMAKAAMTAGATTKQLEDTTFGDEETEDEEEEDSDDDITIPDSTQRTEDLESEDSEGIVVASPTRGMSAVGSHADTVVIIISHLSLEEHCDAIQNPNVKKLFVEYRFLGYPAEELETPFSLPKPKPLSQIAFNFRKVFHVDMEKHYEHRQYLASMLLPDDPDDGRIGFTVVSEPNEDNDEEECCDVGLAFVSLREVLKNGHDIIDQDVDIVDVDDEETVIGTLNLTVECIEALRAVQKEMSS